jgi:hypothetical protein
MVGLYQAYIDLIRPNSTIQAWPKNREKHNFHSTWMPKCKPITSSGAQLKQQQSVLPWGTIGRRFSGKIAYYTQNQYTILYVGM